MTNPPILVITGLGGYFILNFLQKSGYHEEYRYHSYTLAHASGNLGNHTDNHCAKKCRHSFAATFNLV